MKRNREAFSESGLIARLLLENGANANKQNTAGETALMYAARSNNTSVAEELLEYVADIEAKNYMGMTALAYAARWGGTAVLRILLEKGLVLNRETLVVRHHSFMQSRQAT